MGVAEPGKQKALDTRSSAVPGLSGGFQHQASSLPYILSFASIWEDSGSFGRLDVEEEAAGAVPSFSPHRPGGTGSKTVFRLNNLTEIHHYGVSW